MNIEQISATGHVTTLNGLPGMSSQEIAEITGKRHDHVLRDIRKMLGELGLTNAPKSGEVQFAEAQYRDAKGQSRPLAVLDKELTFTLLSRYSFKLSNLIVKRWLELEGTGFVRVSVREAVAHLVEREKDSYRAAMKSIKQGPQCHSPQAKALRREKAERNRCQRQASREANKTRKQGKEVC